MLFYIIDDHQMFSEAMKTIVHSQFSQAMIRTFSKGSEALSKLSEETPDIILLDLDMTGMNGLTMLDILSQSGKNIPVLVCSGNLTEQNKKSVMTSGASGFLSKAQGTEDIFTAIDTVLNKQPYPADARTYIDDSQTHILSHRQRVILRLMQSGMANSDIANTLFLSTNTIKTHIRLMYNTLDVTSRIECLNKAREMGLLDTQ